MRKITEKLTASSGKIVISGDEYNHPEISFSELLEIISFYGTADITIVSFIDPIFYHENSTIMEILVNGITRNFLK